MSSPLTPQQCDDIDAAIAAYRRSHDHPAAFACCSAHAVADHVPALLATVRHLTARLNAVHELCDEQEKAARLFEFPTPEWITAVRAAAEPPASV